VRQLEEEMMRRRARAKLGVLAACGVLSLSAGLPAGGVADTGGVPHTTKPCKAKKKPKKHAARNSHGRKCGFNYVPPAPPVGGEGEGSEDGGTV
jgi:hypothetical protein